MKNIIGLVFLIVICIKTNAQQSNYINISNICGKDIAQKFQLKQQTIKEISENRNSIKIEVLPITNSNNEYTEISQNLSPMLSNVIQQSIKGGFSVFNSIFVNYSESTNQNCDFYLKANYSFSDNLFVINNIFLISNISNQQIAFEQSICEISNSLELQTKDYAIVADNIKQLSRSIVTQFKLQQGLKQVKINNFVEATNNLPSHFSNILASYLETDFPSIANISVQRNQSRSLNENICYTIDGKYFVEGEKLRINCNLTDPQNNIIVASANAYIKLIFLSNNKISYTPQNIKQFNEDQRIIDKEKIKNDFFIDVWTNKGNENPIYEDGEQMTITIEASKECYIRIIDIFADGTKLLLLDNFKIETSMINKPYTLPQSFLCTGPDFGAERILVLAQTSGRFENIPTTDYYGYKKIENFTRGFVQLTNNQKAEKYINLITVPKR